jgi:hypothetical protein
LFAADTRWRSRHSYSTVSGGGLCARAWRRPVDGATLVCGELQGGFGAHGQPVPGGPTLDGGLDVQCLAALPICPDGVRSAPDGCGLGQGMRSEVGAWRPLDLKALVSVLVGVGRAGAA